MIVIHLARKPTAGTVADNALNHGTGALNVDDARIKEQDAHEHTAKQWPANLILTPHAASTLDEQAGPRTSGLLAPHHVRNVPRFAPHGVYATDPGIHDSASKGRFFGGDSGKASRFFKILGSD